MTDSIDRNSLLDDLKRIKSMFHNKVGPLEYLVSKLIEKVEEMPSAEPEIIRCKDCKHWKQQTNYQGIPLSFGFCESDCMWRSLYGETYEVDHIDTDDDFYCGYAERRTE